VARPATGQVVEDRRGDGTIFALRFHAYGKRQYVSLGSAREGWTREKAEEELGYVLQQVARGVWSKPAPRVNELPPPLLEQTNPTFHEFASEWLERKRLEVDDSTYQNYRWALVNHLLPYFKDHRIREISVSEVDLYRITKVRRREQLGRGISNTSFNKTVARLAQVLEDAVEYGWIPSNPAAGKRRRLRRDPPTHTFLELDEIHALLDAASELDREARADRKIGRRAILATLVLAGPRVSELCGLEVRDVNLAAGRLVVRDAKTPSGIREIDVTPALRDELTSYRAGARLGRPHSPFFPTSRGGRRDKDNVRTRVLLPTLIRANMRRSEHGLAELPHVTPHSLRRTYISLLLLSGAEPQYVMQQVGHADPDVTLRLYAKVLRRVNRGHGDRLDALLQSAREDGFRQPFRQQERESGAPFGRERDARSAKGPR
jgi:integrase